MRNIFNISERVPAQWRHGANNRTAICIATLIGLFISPDAVRSQVEFRKPNVPRSRTLGGTLIGNAERHQDGLKESRKSPFNETENSEFSLIPESKNANPTTSIEQPAISTISIAEFSEDGFLPVELVKGGLTAQPIIRSDEMLTQKNQGSNSGQGYLASRLANSQQESEEQRPVFIGQSNFETEGLEEIRQNFPDGRPRIIRYVTQDEQGNYYNHGPWKVLNQAQPQEIVAAGTYKQGRMHGQWRRQHDAGSSGLFATQPFNLFKGPFLSVATFHDGKLNGIWSIFDPNQRNIFEINYKDGVRHGTATWWYPDRSKMREASFKDGLLHGEILAWDEEEKLVRQEEFVDGRRIVRNTTFYRPDQKQTEDYFLDSQLIPEGEDNWWDAKPTPYLARGEKVQNGPSMKWYENNQPKQQGQYKDGLQLGQFTWWHASGNKQIAGFYADGKKNRLWTWWYENGMKQFEGHYEDDEPIGRWRSWHADGQLRKEENFPLEPAAVSNDDLNATNTESTSPNEVIEMPSETLPIPDSSNGTPASETILEEPLIEDLEGIEPLNFNETPAQEQSNETEDHLDQPNNGSNVDGDQTDGSLPSKLFEGQVSFN